MINKSPKVSVVSIAYNQEKYIRETLEGFIMQRTDFDFEVIIADDCSRDKTPEIIKEYGRKHPNIFKPILRDHNIGIQQNFYGALRAAKGQYIAICEGDDYWTDPEKLQRQVDFLDKHPHYTVCFHPVMVFFENDEGKNVIYPNVKDESKFNTEELLKKNFIQTNSVMYRRQNYAHLPDDILPLDWYLHLYHAQFGKIGFIDRVMSVYRRHPGGVWWDSHNNKIWKKYGISHLKLYTALLKIYGQEHNYKQIITNKATEAIHETLLADDSKGQEIARRVVNDFPEFTQQALFNSYNENEAKDRLIALKDEYIDEIEKKTDALEKEKAQILQSRTFKTGRLILNPPKKLRSYKTTLLGKLQTPVISVGLITNGGKTNPKGSAFIRLIEPLTHPSISRRVSLEIFNENTVDVGSGITHCIVQRTAFDDIKTAKKFISSTKKRGIKIITDNDDAFDMIPKTHPEYRVYKSKVTALKYIIDNADEAWFSTKRLLEHYDTKTKKFVMQNNLDSRIWKNFLTDKTTKLGGNVPLQILYMGTNTHDSDFRMILPALDELYALNPDSFELTVVGISDDLPVRSWTKRQAPENSSYPEFVSWLLKQGPFDVGLAPLRDTEFNKNKSDIKCLDYLACGIKPLVSDVVPYSDVSLNNLIIRIKNTQEAWMEALAKQIAQKDQSRKHKPKFTQKARRYIMDKRSTQRTAKDMLSHLTRLSNHTNNSGR